MLRKFISLVGETKTRLLKAEVEKVCKVTHENKVIVENRLNRQIHIEATSHFEDRFNQRFEESEDVALSGAIARAVRCSKTIETAYGNCAKVAQKYVDKLTSIVVVLEKQGQYKATLVTVYKLGQELLISDEELSFLKRNNI